MYKQLNEATVFCDKYCKHARVIVAGGPVGRRSVLRASVSQTFKQRSILCRLEHTLLLAEDFCVKIKLFISQYTTNCDTSEPKLRPTPSRSEPAGSSQFVYKDGEQNIVSLDVPSAEQRSRLQVC